MLRNGHVHEAIKPLLPQAIHLAGISQKFFLPENGHLIDDKEFRALDDTQPLRLPYPIIALEYSLNQNIPIEQNEVRSSKRVVLAREHRNGIGFIPIMYYDHIAEWGLMPEAWIPKINYLDRKWQRHSPEDYIRVKIISSKFATAMIDDYGYEVRVLLSFLNALQCSNVHTEKIRLPLNKKERGKSAISFDEYHILTIDVPGEATIGSGKGIKGTQKREHLRRGHIRRYANGLKIWVNATVINAGKGLNKIKKDYLVCSSFKN